MNVMCKFTFEVRQSFTGFALQDPQLTPNKSFQRTDSKFTPFAFAKAAPFESAAELRR